MNEFMTKNLGYKKYFAQGGDWGSAVCNWLGHIIINIVRQFILIV